MTAKIQYQMENHTGHWGGDAECKTQIVIGKQNLCCIVLTSLKKVKSNHRGLHFEELNADFATEVNTSPRCTAFHLHTHYICGI